MYDSSVITTRKLGKVAEASCMQLACCIPLPQGACCCHETTPKAGQSWCKLQTPADTGRSLWHLQLVIAGPLLSAKWQSLSGLIRHKMGFAAQGSRCMAGTLTCSLVPTLVAVCPALLICWSKVLKPSWISSTTPSKSVTSAYTVHLCKLVH